MAWPRITPATHCCRHDGRTLQIAPYPYFALSCDGVVGGDMSKPYPVSLSDDASSSNFTPLTIQNLDNSAAVTVDLLSQTGDSTGLFSSCTHTKECESTGIRLGSTGTQEQTHRVAVPEEGPRESRSGRCEDNGAANKVAGRVTLQQVLPRALR